ncbi:MAG: SDR family oxidoreductase [Planctomycetes bacterium]|nr:SDR family oxidoreductase [Planctomycetota bacterium]
MSQLAGKVIIVTGSNTGIGRAIAERCASEGAKVLIHGLDHDEARQVAASLGQSAVVHVDDLADPAAPQRIIAAAVGAFGRIDGLVNNAAAVVRSNLADTDAALFDRVMAVNVRAPLLLIQAAAEHLEKSAGAVVNIGSVNAYCGETNLLAYSISKGALMTLSRNVAEALAARHVRVNHLNLGWVLTPNEHKAKIAEGMPENWPDKLGSEHIPSGKMTTPEQIAAHVVFWLCDASRPVTGSVVELEQHVFLGRNPSKEV